MKNATAIEREGLGINAINRHAVIEGTAQAGIIILLALAALAGVWGFACLAGGIMEGGLTELARGFISAVSGR